MLFDAIRRRRQEKADSQQAWLARWQSLVPEENRNVPVTVEGQTRIAYIQINQFVVMLQDGLLDEIRALLASGISPAATAMQAIGYKEYVDCLTAGGDVHAATALVQQRSRNYAKRQLTWLRRNEQIHWILQPREPDFAAVFRQACAYIPFFA